MAEWNGYKSTIAIESEAYRPCIVKGERDALFHRWIFDEKVLINFEVRVLPSMKEEIVERAKKSGVFSDGIRPVPVKSTLALVEYKDGTVAKVDPEDIRFLDSDYKFRNECVCLPSYREQRKHKRDEEKERYYVGKDFNTKDWFVYDNETDRYICWGKTEQACNEFVERLKGE